MTDILGPADAPNFTTSRPADDRSIGSTDTWMKDCTGPNVNDGTKLRAGLFNSILANLRVLVRGNGNTGGGPAVVTEDNADDMLLRAAQHLIQRGQPIYGVDKTTLEKTEPYLPGSIDVMAVGNLPNELPRDASKYFGEQLMKYVLPDLLQGESEMIRKATIVKEGVLTEEYDYLCDYAAGK